MPKNKTAKAKAERSEAELSHIAPRAKPSREPIVPVTTLVPCPKCGKRMTTKTLNYSHSSVCGAAVAKAAPKPKPKPAPKAEAREEVAMPPPQASYHDIVKQRVQHMREQREHRIKSLFSRAV
jgi:ssDNA-binding Zn-finger/Zn-ribbon topoisomerase 1